MKHLLRVLLLAIGGTTAGAFGAAAQTTNTQTPNAQTSNDIFRHVSPEADRVYHIKLDAIGSKVPWISFATLLKDSKMGRHNPIGAFDLAQLMNSGIDFHQDVVITETNCFEPDSIKYFSIILHLTDSGKFVALLKAKASDTKGDPIHFIHIAKQRVAIHDHDAGAWTDRLAVLTIYVAPTRTDNNDAPTPKATLQARTARRCAAALHGFPDTKFLSDPRVVTAFSDDADIHIWSRQSGNGTGLASLFGSKARNFTGFSKILQKANNDAVVNSLSFLPGKIIYHSLRLIAPAEKTYMEGVAGQGLSHEFATVIPAGEIMGLATIHLDMHTWADSMGKSPYAAMFTDGLQKKGLTLQDVPKAIKGDFMILAYTPDKMTPGDKKMPTLYGVATIGDKAIFQKLAQTVKFIDASAPDNSTATDSTATDTTAHHKMPLYYGIQGDLATVALSRENVNSFFSRPAPATPGGTRLFTSQVYNNSFTLGIDMQATADFLTLLLTKEDTVSAHDKQLLDGIRKIDVLQFSTGALQNDAMETNVELRMTDTNKNALASFVEILASLSKKQ